MTALLCETHVLKNGKCNSESLCELLAKKSCKLKVSDLTEPRAGSNHWYLTCLPLEREGALYRAGMQELDKGICQINKWVLTVFWVFFFP